jgi:hypothetical protein
MGAIKHLMDITELKSRRDMTIRVGNSIDAIKIFLTTDEHD